MFKIYVQPRYNHVSKLNHTLKPQVIYEQTSDSESMYKTLSIEKMISGGCHVLFDTNQHFVRQGMLRLAAVSSKNTVRKDVKLGPKHCFLFTNHMLITERIGEQLSVNKVRVMGIIKCCEIIMQYLNF